LGQKWQKTETQRCLSRLGRDTNRRLADRKVAWLWKKPFQILAEKNESAVLSQIANQVRTIFENTSGEN